MALSTVTNRTLSFALVVDDFKQITKVGLTLSVVFSSLMGYLLGADLISLKEILILSIGGYFTVGASNTFNQIIERDLDARMDRPVKRPIASGRMSVHTALVIASSCAVLGIITLYYLNPKTAMFGAIALFLCACVYTRLKTVTPLAV